MIRAGRVDAVRMLVATVHVRRFALVHLDAVELVQLPVAGQTLAHVRTERVDAARVQMAVITIRTTLLSAFVDVWWWRGGVKKKYVSDSSLDLSFGAVTELMTPAFARWLGGSWATFFADTKMANLFQLPIFRRSNQRDETRHVSRVGRTKLNWS